MLRRAAVAVAVPVLALLAADPLVGQNDCELVGSDVLTITQAGTLGETIYIGSPRIACADGSQIAADSAVVTPPLSLSRLLGRVSFTEENRTLTSDSARYQTDIDRLLAWGGVVLADSAGGSTLRGDTLVYLRAGTARDEDDLTVTGPRVEATLVPAADSSGAPPDPYLVIARRSIAIQGERSFRALGDVQLERGDLRAFGDTATYREDEGTLVLGGRARAQGEGYELSGRRLSVYFTGQDVREVLAQRGARLDTDDVDLTAPVIRIFVEEQALQRLVAASALDGDSVEAPRMPDIPERFRRTDPEPREQLDLTRATAVSEEFLLRADSLDVRTPGEVLERVTAVGRAHGESFARDSLNAEDTEDFIRHDWLEGDTVVALFAPAPLDSAAALPTDSVDGAPGVRNEYVMESLTAVGNARSLYRMDPADSAQAAVYGRNLALHYVLADAIIIRMANGEVQDMETLGATRGIHLEPAIPPGGPIVVPADSAGVPVGDTTAVGTPRPGGRP